VFFSRIHCQGDLKERSAPLVGAHVSGGGGGVWVDFRRGRLWY
jgi:hypothetical protein